MTSRAARESRDRAQPLPRTQAPESSPAAYRRALLDELEARLDERSLRSLIEGAQALHPAVLAERMVSVVPTAERGNVMAEQVGPLFYDTPGVCVVLAGPAGEPISKQAVEQRRKRATVLALKTSDGHWIYPTWQFVDGAVLPALVEVMSTLRGNPPWSVATWLTTPLVELDDASVADWLLAGKDLQVAQALAKAVARRWAA